jgi:hypothetical protein
LSAEKKRIVVGAVWFTGLRKEQKVRNTQASYTQTSNSAIPCPEEISCGRYAIFGDTVNMSSRMESTGMPGKFQTDASTARMILDLEHDGFLLEEREREGINVKGKGKRKTFWIKEHLGEGRFSEVRFIVWGLGFRPSSRRF